MKRCFRTPTKKKVCNKKQREGRKNPPPDQQQPDAPSDHDEAPLADLPTEENDTHATSAYLGPDSSHCLLFMLASEIPLLL